MEHMKIFVMENPFSPTRCKKIAHIRFIYFKSMIQNHHNPRHTFQTFSLTTYVFLMLVVRALESYLILDKRVEIFLKFYDRWFRRVTFRYKEVISLVTTSETNDDNTLVLFSTRPKPFLIAFGSLITNFYTEKKFFFFTRKKNNVLGMFLGAWKNSFLHFVFLTFLHWLSSVGYLGVCLVFFLEAANEVKT